MSRTFKDAPYTVRAKRDGELTPPYSYRNHFLRKLFIGCTVIFYAHEVSEKEELESILSELDLEWTCHEKSGYLIRKNAEPYSAFGSMSRYLKHNEFGKHFVHLVDPTRFAVGKVCPRSDLFESYEMKPKHNIFYIFEIEEKTAPISPMNNEYHLPTWCDGFRCTCEYCGESRTRDRYFSKRAKNQLDELKADFNATNDIEELRDDLL